MLDGKPFGDAGPYERITGRVYFSVPIANIHNRPIVDLANAVNLQDGEVEFSADFVAVRPKDAAKGNGTLLLENPNRGHSRILSLVDGGDEDLAHSAGDAWLLRNGFTVVALGWQWDAAGPDALRLYAPIAKDHGKTITGLLRGDIMLPAKADEIPLGHIMVGNIGGSEYPVAQPDDPRNTLTVRDSREGKRTMIPRSEWQFAATVDGKLTPSDRSIHLNGGFAPGRIYEYVYVVADPVVAGLSFAAVRDFASYAKHAPDAVTPAARVLGEGISQNGRFLRNFLYQGFNADEEGRIALDGVLAHVAGAGRGSFNYRFAQPSRDAQPTSSIFFPTDIFPFTDQPEVDPLTQRESRPARSRRGRKCRAQDFLLAHVLRILGTRRLAHPHHRRRQARRRPSAPTSASITSPACSISADRFRPRAENPGCTGKKPQSPLPIRFFWRAMIANMDAWVRNGTAPPPSAYSTIAAHTLVPLRELKFPQIPHVALPTETNTAYRLDYGPNWRDGILSMQPPHVGKPFPVLVPQVDADGNELGGIHLPEITVPLATYTGWNLRDPVDRRARVSASRLRDRIFRSPKMPRRASSPATRASRSPSAMRAVRPIWTNLPRPPTI